MECWKNGILELWKIKKSCELQVKGYREIRLRSEIQKTVQELSLEDGVRISFYSNIGDKFFYAQSGILYEIPQCSTLYILTLMNRYGKRSD
jgi:hypothetical protein